eukprot:1575231-Rhodomonas_salina.1
MRDRDHTRGVVASKKDSLASASPRVTWEPEPYNGSPGLASWAADSPRQDSEPASTRGAMEALAAEAGGHGPLSPGGGSDRDRSGSIEF